MTAYAKVDHVVEVFIDVVCGHVCVCVCGGGGLGAQGRERVASYLYPLANTKKKSLEQAICLNYNSLICS